MFIILRFILSVFIFDYLFVIAFMN